MWILNWFPSSVVELLLIAGAIGCFLSIVVINQIAKWIPGVAVHSTVFQLISIIVLLTGVYLKGIQNTQKEWEVKILKAQQKVSAAENEANEANNKLAKKTAEKDKVIYIKGETIYRYIDREIVKNKEVVKFVENCTIQTTILELHNAAATNPPIEPHTK